MTAVIDALAWARRALRRPAAGATPAARALAWLRAHEARGGGVLVHSRARAAYPEVSGYLVPTLLAYGEHELAHRVVRWLLAVQRPDGGFGGPDGTPYVFDTAQVLRGLLAAPAMLAGARDAARRAADHLCRAIVDGGVRGFGPRYPAGDIPEGIHVYALPPLRGAAEVFGVAAYADAADRCLAYYRARADFLRLDGLTHFLAYELEALIDLGHADAARPALDALRAVQAPDGGVRGRGDGAWVCTPGLAQLAVCWYKTGATGAADRALAWLERRQERSGGFRGSYGAGAAYFPDVEPAWAVKYFLDAAGLRAAAAGRSGPC